MKTEIISIKKLKPNPANPRTIRDDKFHKLVQSVKDFPQMLEIRPIVVNDQLEVLGGNMRLRACIEAGMKEVTIIRASELTEDQQREFIIKDNVGFGEWDMDALANEWDAEELQEWSLDLPVFADQDFSGKNKEIDTDEMEDEMTLTFKFQPSQFFEIKAALSEIADTPEDALLKLLENAGTQISV